MPRRAGVLKGRSPRSFMVRENFPDGRLRSGAPAAVSVAAELARRLRTAVDASESVSAVARAAGVERSTIYDILNGATWPDLATIATLEEVLAVDLWPRRFE